MSFQRTKFCLTTSMYDYLGFHFINFYTDLCFLLFVLLPSA